MLLFPFYRKENSDSEKFSNLPKIIQLIGGEKVCLMLKARHFLPMAVEEILMKPVYLVREGSTGPSSWEQTGLQMAQEALAGEIVFDHDCEGGPASSEISRKRHSHLFYESFKGGILKSASFLHLLIDKRASEQTFQCLF